jgi:hypothetical protein
MGRDLGIAVLRHGRALLPAVLLVVALGAAGFAPAYADDPTPPGPTRAPSPVLSPPSQQQIDDAKSALDRVRNGGTTPPPVLTQVSGPTAPDAGPSVTSRISDQDWWTIAAAALVLLVLSETTRLTVRRAKHRKGA